MIHMISEERKRLHDATANASPRPGYGIVHGDFNFVGAHGIRWEGRANGIWVVPRKPSDIWSQKRYEGLTAQLVDYSPTQETHLRRARPRAAHLGQPGPNGGLPSGRHSAASSSSPNSSSSSSSSSSTTTSSIGRGLARPTAAEEEKVWHGSPLDHVYIDLSCWQQVHVKVAVTRKRCPFQLHQDRVSDHAPISTVITMSIPKRRSAAPEMINKWIASSVHFRDYVFLAAAERVEVDGPYVNLAAYKVIFQEAAKHTARALRIEAANTPAARASAIASAARAVHTGDWSTLRRAWTTLPELQPMFAARGRSILITDTEGFARLSQSVLHLVAHKRLGQALAAGAARPKVEALLRQTKRFLPHRRRDALGAIVLPNGNATNNKDEMTSALSAHWSATFVGTPTIESERAFFWS